MSARLCPCDILLILKYVVFNVTDPPREDKTYCRETKYSLALGDSQTVCCPVSGYPPPFVTWKKNGIQLNQESSVLKIYNLASQDFGNYTCTATNFETTVSVDVFIQEKVGLSFDIIDGSKLKIHPLHKVKQYMVKVSGQDILDDYFTGVTTSLEIFYDTLRMKTSSDKPKETKINVQVLALTDEGYKTSPVKILTIRSHQVILKTDISLVLLVLLACLTW
ncbi:Hemicentin-1 [Porites harrisoni]